MKNKRGQITIFVIVSIIIILGIGLFFILNSSNQENKNMQENFISDYVYSCIDSVGRDSIFFIGLQGGYYNTPAPKEEYTYIEIPIYWDNGKENIPDKETIEKELEDYFIGEFSNCINNFERFREEEFDFKIRKISVDSEINKKEINFKINYPIIVQREEETYEFEEFNRAIKFNFIEKYEIVKQIIEEQKKTPNSFPLGFIADLSYEKDFTFETINLEEGEILITLIFKQGENETPFIYSFINKYNWEKTI